MSLTNEVERKGRKICEPAHSIVQFPPDDHDPKNSGSGGEVTEQRLRFGLKGIWDWVKKIGGFFHLSRLGSGHTESLEWAASNWYVLPRDTRYEAKWWDRTVKLDGRLNMAEVYHEVAKESAEGYAWQVSLGNLTKLRRFLEVSIQKTDQVSSYVTCFFDELIVRPSRDLIVGKFKSLFKIKSFYTKDYRVILNEKRQQVIDFLLGFTRQRRVLHPAWADDAALWL